MAFQGLPSSLNGQLSNLLNQVIADLMYKRDGCDD